MKYMIMHYASQADIDAANVAHGLGHGPSGAAVAAWPTVALVGSYELLMLVIRGSQVAQDGVPDKRKPGIRSRSRRWRCSPPAGSGSRSAGSRDPAQFHVGQPRAQRLRDYLAAGARREGSLAA